jgi:hypothetical protein
LIVKRYEFSNKKDNRTPCYYVIYFQHNSNLIPFVDVSVSVRKAENQLWRVMLLFHDVSKEGLSQAIYTEYPDRNIE